MTPIRVRESMGIKYTERAGGSLPAFSRRSVGAMPFVNIKITREGATAEQKAALIRGATQLLVDVLGKNPATTIVVIEEVDTENWGIGGESVAVRRKSGK